ncbi:hypothetical protein [Flavihumibacter fluvii]|uniref:hypothetical protein n=1 Tax=Flavihumibacter fluvii TaxID=2838157 RepID=UPI001BDE04F4|nr:hypothetical protein [Flavihumibacter fluvii]ULQ51958.1 hypothetical protein KJS93_17855 [Flavihumibacter fluvii]
MAKTNQNLLTQNYAGKAGNQFSFRMRNDHSFIAMLPKKSKKPASADPQTQQMVKEKFRRAILYAKTVFAKDPELLAQYEAVRKKSQSAFNVAFMDAYIGPVLRDLRTDEYEGVAGNEITVEALDNFRVKSVKFTIFSPDGTKLEEGEAVNTNNGYGWVYTTREANPTLAGTKLKITAKDIPDNMTVLEKVL